MKKNIIFDFDGVILNSHKIKTDAFFELFKLFGNKIGYKSKKFHLKNIGKDRYFKFIFIYKNFLKKKINPETIRKLDKDFDQYINKKIDGLKVSKELINFLKLKKKYNFYISTSTPTKKIKTILKKKKIFKYFNKIYGSPQKKVQHINLIKRNMSPTLFIGDSLEDLQAAKKSKIQFLLKNNNENKKLRTKYKKKMFKVNSFKKLEKKISKII